MQKYYWILLVKIEVRLLYSIIFYGQMMYFIYDIEVKFSKVMFLKFITQIFMFFFKMNIYKFLIILGKILVHYLKYDKINKNTLIIKYL